MYRHDVFDGNFNVELVVYIHLKKKVFFIATFFFNCLTFDAGFFSELACQKYLMHISSCIMYLSVLYNAAVDRSFISCVFKAFEKALQRMLEVGKKLFECCLKSQ